MANGDFFDSLVHGVEDVVHTVETDVKNVIDDVFGTHGSGVGPDTPLSDIRWEGMSNTQLAAAVRQLNEGSSASSMTQAADALANVAADLARINDTLQTQMRAIGVNWQSQTASDLANQMLTESAAYGGSVTDQGGQVSSSMSQQAQAYATARNGAPQPETLQGNAQGGGGLISQFGSPLLGHSDDQSQQAAQANAARAKAVDTLNNYTSASQHNLNTYQPLPASPAISLHTQAPPSGAGGTTVSGYVPPSSGGGPAGGGGSGGGPGPVPTGPSGGGQSGSPLPNFGGGPQPGLPNSPTPVGASAGTPNGGLPGGAPPNGALPPSVGFPGGAPSGGSTGLPGGPSTGGGYPGGTGGAPGGGSTGIPPRNLTPGPTSGIGPTPAGGAPARASGVSPSAGAGLSEDIGDIAAGAAVAGGSAAVGIVGANTEGDKVVRGRSDNEPGGFADDDYAPPHSGADEFAELDPEQATAARISAQLSPEEPVGPMLMEPAVGSRRDEDAEHRPGYGTGSTDLFDDPRLVAPEVFGANEADAAAGDKGGSTPETPQAPADGPTDGPDDNKGA